MPITSRFDAGQALTVSVANRQKAIQDIVYNATPLTRILLGDGIDTPGSRIKTKRGGGPELRIPVMFDKLEAQWFTGYDIINITPKELLNSAIFNWSRVVAPFSLNGTELLYNSGEEEFIDLAATYIEAAEMSAKEAFEEGLISDGTGDGGRQMQGLGVAVPLVVNAGVYGSIDRGTVAEWRTTEYDISSGDVTGFTTWDSTTARAIISQITLARSRNGRYPDLWIFDSVMWAAIEASFVALQRFPTSERLARLGMAGYTYMTAAGPVDLVAAGGIGNVMPASTAFGIDTKGLSIYEFPGQSFVPFHPGNGLRPINQDAVAQGIVWSGQLVLENPLFTIRLTV